MPFLVKDLIDEHRKPLTVRADDSLQIALTRMTEHDYSQLPIVDAENRYLGMVTSDSILRALKTFDVAPKSLLVRDAKMKVPAFDEERELFDLLDGLRDFYALPIVDKEKRVIGVVTGYDATEYFRRRSEDMMFVEDIEGYLKDHIGAAHTSESGGIDDTALQQSIKQHARGAPIQRRLFFTALQRYLERQSEFQGGKRPHLDVQLAGDIFTQTFENDTPASLDDLTLADYVALISSKEQWERYEGIFHPLARDKIHNMLDDVRKTRNAMAHF
ncbi:MAG TPA: CBS domain-containing protein, partial [Ktedonobacterales bacterium]|nr:CBS domain-containing protein [Ktedonobacterales bacterium]